MQFQVTFTPSSETDLGLGASHFCSPHPKSLDQEVADLGQSEKFMSFLAERSKETGKTSLEEIERRLKQAE